MTQVLSHTWEYSIEDCSIPAPFIHANISNPDNPDLNSSATFLVDSGCDMTLIKQEIFDILELIVEGDASSTYELASGIEVEYPISNLVIKIPELNIKEQLQVAIDTENRDNLLGRDFLNKFGLYLDGPALEYTFYA